MLIITALAIVLQLGPPVPESLENAVSSYWNLITQGQMYQALESVEESSRNAFIRRHDIFTGSWRLSDIQMIDSNRAAVTVGASCLVQGRADDCTVTEQWVRLGDSWKLSAPEISDASLLFRRANPRTPQPGALRVLPRAMKIHFISPTRTGTILIENGLDQAVEIIGLQYDSTRFKVEGDLKVGPGKISQLAVRYIGNEIEKDLNSEILLLTRSEAGEKAHSIPVTYNFVSPGTRALLGLTPKEAEQLLRTDDLRPAPSTARYDRDRPDQREQRPELEQENEK